MRNNTAKNIKIILAAFFSISLLLSFSTNTLAQDLVEFNFKAKPTQENTCITNTVTVSEPDKPIDSQDSATTQVGEGNCREAPGDSTLARLANDLIQAFEEHCGGKSITRFNYKCIENNIPTSAKYPDRAYGEIIFSASSYAFLQCVGFVSAVFAGVIGERITVGGYAGNVAEIGGLIAPSGVYNWTARTPTAVIQAGDFVVWAGNPGHMAVVTTVLDQDRGVFNVAEANFDFQGSTRIRSVIKEQVAGWLRKT